jgi:hypothetical protein
MNGPRATGFGLLLGLAFAAFFMPAAQFMPVAMAQVGPPGGPSGRPPPSGTNPNRQPLPDQSISPRTSDPEAYDAIDLFSRLCVSTHGSQVRATAIVGGDDSAIEKMQPGMLRGMENGQVGGTGWIIRMPLGDRILLEFPPDLSCVVRVPHVRAADIEAGFRNLLDQYSASGQFAVHRIADQTQTIDKDGKPTTSERGAPADKLKFHILAYRMSLPDSTETAELVLQTTDSDKTGIQANIVYSLVPGSAGNGAR